MKNRNSKKSPLPFAQATYRTQIRRLRSLAQIALAKYSIQIEKIDFINHGENTTFRITSCRTPKSKRSTQAKHSQKYLLRIHRANYHTRSAIIEELRWLNQLATNNPYFEIRAPKPIRTVDGQLLAQFNIPELGGLRFVSVLEWTDGTFVENSLTEQKMKNLGALIGLLQKSTISKKTTIRQYWNAEGLVGREPKFGPIDRLNGISAYDQNQVIQLRKKVLSKLKAFEKRYPKRQGFIHADLHFGNLVWRKNQCIPIDFDDCGWGFHAYDLVIPLLWVHTVSLAYEAKSKKPFKSSYPKLKSAFLNGYKTHMPWDAADEAILPYLGMARKLTMLGWLQARSDNPKLRSRLKKAVEGTLTASKNGIEFLL